MICGFAYRIIIKRLGATIGTSFGTSNLSAVAFYFLIPSQVQPHPTRSHICTEINRSKSFANVFSADPHCLLRCCCEARRNARSDPPPLLAGHGVSDSVVSFFLLSDFRQFLQVLGEFFPPPKPPHGPPESRQASALIVFLEVFSKRRKTSSQNH